MHNLKYIYHEDLSHYDLSDKDYSFVKPLLDFSFSDLNKSIPSFSILIDPLIVAWESQQSHNHDLYKRLFGGNIVLKDGIFYHESTTLKPFKKHHRVMLSLILATDSGHNKITLPIDKSFLKDCSPFFIHDLLDSFKKPLSINIVSNDKEWLSLFDNAYQHGPVYWVEGDFDKRTYSFFYPDSEYRIAENWMNVIRATQHSVLHYGIIDKDGFIPEQHKLENISFSRYAEAENIWLNEKLLNLYHNKNSSFIVDDFKNYVIDSAIKDKEETIARFIRRQEEQKNRGFPYAQHDAITLHLHSYTDSLHKRKYDEIIMIYDNKKMFNHLLKSLSFKNNVVFFTFLTSLRKDIKSMMIKPITT